MSAVNRFPELPNDLCQVLERSLKNGAAPDFVAAAMIHFAVGILIGVGHNEESIRELVLAAALPNKKEASGQPS